MRAFFIGFIFYSLCPFVLKAQDVAVSIDILVKDEITGRNLVGAKVEVYHDGVFMKSYFTDKRGVIFNTPLEGVYLIKISYPGTVTKMAEIDCTFGNPEDLPSVCYCQMQCGLFIPKCPEKFDYLEKEPMIKFFMVKDGFLDYTKNYTLEQLAKIERIKMEHCKEASQPHDPEENLLSKIRLEAAIIAPVVLLTSLANNVDEEDRVAAGPKEKTKGKSFRLKYFKRDLHAWSAVKI